MAIPEDPPGLPFSPPPGEGPEGSSPGGMGMRPSFICSMWSMLSGPSLSICFTMSLSGLSGPSGPLFCCRQPTRGGMLAVTPMLPSLELVLPPEPDAVVFLFDDELNCRTKCA